MAPKAASRRVTARAKAKAKAKATFVRKQQVKLKNDRLTARRKALQSINSLLGALSLSELALKSKHVDMYKLGRALRVLEKRCADRLAFRSAVEAWKNNGGKLPAGVRLVDVNEVEVLADDEESAPLVRGHKVLKATFELKSQAFMLTYNSRNFTAATWAPFRAHMKALHAKHGSKAWSGCIEESLHASQIADAEPSSRIHTHGYLLWTDGVGYRSETLDEFVFQGVHPRIDKCVQASNTRLPRRAALHGLWYVYVRKDGTLDSDSNWTPWTTDYVPSSSWLVSLWEQHKLSHTKYLEYSAKFRTGHSARRRDVLEVIAEESNAAVKEHVSKELRALNESEPLRDFRVFQLIDDFVDLFSSSRWRRPILLIVGGTNAGKSLLGKEVLRRVCEKLGLPTFVEVTVESADHLDFSHLKIDQHGGIMFDGVGDAMLLHANREVLQGRPKECDGGQSRTMIYSYTYTLARRAVVATMDLSAKRLHLLKTDHWLSNPDNVWQLWLDGPAWSGGAHAQVSQVPPRQKMAAWTVDALANYLEGEDAEGLASVVRSNSVNGSDLLTFTEATCVESLRCTPFAARKLVGLREKFINA